MYKSVSGYLIFSYDGHLLSFRCKAIFSCIGYVCQYIMRGKEEDVGDIRDMIVMTMCGT
jgi:hypothetical protein